MSGIHCPKCGQAATYLNGVVVCPRCDTSQRDASPPLSPPPLSPGHTTGEFDPYHRWLGIPKSDRPANHYRLLGIPLFESNSDVIESAADRQMAHVRLSANGPRSDFAQQILNEIATARVCLLNSVSKVNYDQQLAALSSPSPCPEASALHAGGNAATPLTSYTPRKKRVAAAAPSPVPRIMIIVIGGMAGLAIASYLLDQIREQEGKRAREAVQRSQPIAPPRQRSAIPQSRTTIPSPLPKETEPQLAPVVPPPQHSQPSVPRPIPELGNQSSPTLKATPAESPSRRTPKMEPSPRSTDSPAESSETEREPPPNLDLSSLPADVDLPPISAREAKLLTWTAIPKDLKIELASDLITLDSAYAFVAEKASPSTPVHWQIYLQEALDVGTQQVVVADLTAVDNGLGFRWTDNADKATPGQLKNCLMQLKSGSESHKIALRSPLRSKATRLPPEKDRFKATFDVEDHPRAECLRLDAHVTYDGAIVAPQSGTETTTKGKRLDFKIDDLPEVAIQVTLLSQQDKSLTLQAIPRHQLSGARQPTLSTEEVDKLEQRIRKSVVKSQNDLVKAQNALRTAEQAFLRGNSATKAVQRKIIENKTKEIANNPRKTAEMIESLKAVEGLRRLVSEVRLNTLIHYRIYAESNESWLLLVDGEYAIPSLP